MRNGQLYCYFHKLPVGLLSVTSTKYLEHHLTVELKEKKTKKGKGTENDKHNNCKHNILDNKLPPGKNLRYLLIYLLAQLSTSCSQTKVQM